MVSELDQERRLRLDEMAKNRTARWFTNTFPGAYWKEVDVPENRI